MTSFSRRALRAAGVFAGSSALLLLSAGAAAAHISIDPSTPVAGSYAVLTVALPHGCDASSTTSVAITIPDEITGVTPTVNPGWTVEKKMTPLDAPADHDHSGATAERVDQVVYTAITPLPADLRDTFELSMKLPDTPGATLVFPTLQTCEQGETSWSEVAAPGQPEPSHPAPAITLTEPDDAADDGDAVSWVALGLGAVGVILGGLALLRRPSGAQRAAG